MKNFRQVALLLLALWMGVMPIATVYGQTPNANDNSPKVYLPLVASVSNQQEITDTTGAPTTTGQTIAGAAFNTTLAPTAYATASGASGGQPVTNLAAQDQSGTQNDWNKYVEFNTPNVIYSGYRPYLLPAYVTPASITGLQVKANYLGPAKSAQTWTWSLYNWTSKTWTSLSNNSSAASWRWTLFTFNAGGSLANYVNSSTREIRVQVQSNSALDDMDLDYEAVLVTHTSVPPTSLIQKLAIPSYFYPGSLWTQLENGAPTVGLAIINPNSGVGASIDQGYVSQTNHTKAKGILVIGYVYTGYGKRAAATVKSEIDKYYQWYGVNGIFFDEASNDCVNLAYYQALYNYVKTKGGTAKVVLNPGINTGECYMAATDLIITFEDSYANYLTWQPSGWEVKYPANRFWHLVLNTTQANMPNAIQLSKNRRAGWIYVTPDNLPNPWDTLPGAAYWSDELYRASH